MACCFRLSNNMISPNFLFKNRYLPILLTNSRHFCSKENDIKNGSSTLKETSKEKQDEDPKETPVKRRILQFKTAPVSDEMKEAAKQKLKSLLSDIEVKSENSGKSASNLNLAKPVKRISKKERLKQMEAERITPEKEMNMAVKAVASTFKEDSEKVESELSEKLSTLKLVKTPPIEKTGDTEEAPAENLLDDEVNENLMSSVEEVADTISESPIPPRSELTKRLMRLALDQKTTTENKSMKSVLEGMIIKEKSPSSSDQPTIVDQASVDRKMQLRTKRKMPVTRPQKPKTIEKVNLFDGTPLNIFKSDFEASPDSINTFWQKLQDREVRLLTQYAPSNAFEEMIMWTEQGKHWKLPVDNQIEMGEEENVGFHEHVFLEKHLKGFPTKGPIRHFMELVCVGLSKNPYITVERKIENIEWFRNYFKEKEDILRETGAIE